MNDRTGFVYAGVVTPVAAPSSRTVEAATTGSVIAAQFAGNEGEDNNSARRANAIKGRKQANWLTVAVSIPTGAIAPRSA